MAYRKLNELQEREVAILYFCGLGKEYIAKNYVISESTLRRSILQERSRRLNDLLIELYRNRNFFNRLRNAAHFYLAYNDKDVDQGELVVRGKDQRIFFELNKEVYNVIQTQVAEAIELDYFLRPLNNREQFLRDLFSTYDPTEEAFAIAVETAYKNKEKITKQGLVHLTLQILTAGIKEGALTLTPHKAAKLDEILVRLPKEQRDIIFTKYGFEDGKLKNYFEVGKIFGITSRKAQTIEQQAKSTLAHSKDMNLLVKIRGFTTDDELDKYSAEQKEKAARKELHRRLYLEEIAARCGQIVQNPALLGEGIDTLGLNRRAYNILEQHNVKTIGQLVMHSEEDLFSWPGFGKTSYRIISRKLNERGLSIIKRATCNAPLFRNDSVSYLGLSSRAIDALNSINIKTIGDLTDYNLPDLLKIRNLGQATYLEITGKLHRRDVFPGDRYVKPPYEEEFSDMPVLDFGLSVRARNALRKLEVKTVGDLTKLTEKDLLACKNFGESSLREIEGILDRMTLALRPREREVSQGKKYVKPQYKKDFSNMPVLDLELGVRARRALRKLNVSTVEDLTRFTAEDLLACRQFGNTSLNEIRKVLEELGLTLRQSYT